MTKIEFILPKQIIEPRTAGLRSVGLEYSPQPAAKFIPEEYKNLPSYEEDDLHKPTVKKCIPFLDAMTSGYIIPFFQEYLITVDYENRKWSFDANPSSHWNETTSIFHQPQQIPKNYQETSLPAGKFANKWIIKTPPGYSCLFVHPMNTPKTDFEIISGIIDTDIYDDTVLFPFYFRRNEDVFQNINNKKKEQIHIKLGTPMVQIIPFKRESWKSNSRMKSKKDEITWRKNWPGLYPMFDIYKKLFWRKKHYD